MDPDAPVDGKTFPSASQERALGLWRGRVTMQADFDELPPEIAAAFGVQVSAEKSATAGSPPPSHAPPAAPDR